MYINKYYIMFVILFKTGSEAAAVMRQNGYRNIIIGITGNVLEDDVMQYLRAGADMVLAKPLKMSQLNLVLRHVQEYGSYSSPDMKLVEVFGRLDWVPKYAVVS